MRGIARRRKNARWQPAIRARRRRQRAPGAAVSEPDLWRILNMAVAVARGFVYCTEIPVVGWFLTDVCSIFATTRDSGINAIVKIPVPDLPWWDVGRVDVEDFGMGAAKECAAFKYTGAISVADAGPDRRYWITAVWIQWVLEAWPFPV